MTTEPTPQDRLTADTALRLGVLRHHDTGLTFVSPTLLDLADEDRPTAERIARLVMNNWPVVATAARRLLSARHYGHAA